MSWEALDLALTLHAAPGLVGEVRGRPLPAGITRLLRVALGQSDSLAEASVVTGRTPAQLTDAARFFVEQQLLAREVEHDPWRVLGVHPQASEIELRANHHLLVRLVHPDRGDDWASAHAERVNRAWRLLRHAEDRAAVSVTPPTASGGDREAWVARPVDVRAPLAGAVAAPAAQRPRWRWAAAAVAASAAIATLLWLAPAGDDTPAVVAAAPSPDWYAEAPPVDATMVPPPAPAVPEAAAAAATDPLLAPIVPIDTLVAADAAAPVTRTPVATPPPPPVATPPRHPRPVVPTQRPVAATQIAAAPVIDPPASTPEHPPSVPNAVASAAPVSRPSARRAPTDAETMALLDTFASRYARGDLGGVLGLYARAVHAETARIAALATRYAGEFKASPQRTLNFSGVRWQRHDDRITGEARYELRQRKRGALRARVEHGRIEFELVHEGGASRLLRFDSRAEQRS